MKKIIYILILAFFVSSCATHSRSAKNQPASQDDVHLIWLQNNQLTHPDSLTVPPQFPGGKDALLKFLKDNIRYPEKAREEGVQGFVHFAYVVEKDGNVSSAKIHQHLSHGCTEEVIHAFFQMPRWAPGTINGEPQRVGLQIWIRFGLSEGDTVVTPIFDVETYRMYLRDNRLAMIDSPHTVIRPQFSGGEGARIAFLQNNIKYPIEARRKGIQGRVFIAFTIERDGSIFDARVLQGIDDDRGIHDEAIRLVRSMPKWSPGMIDGEPARMGTVKSIGFFLRGGSCNHNIHNPHNPHNPRNIHNPGQQRIHQDLNRNRNFR